MFVSHVVHGWQPIRMRFAYIVSLLQLEHMSGTQSHVVDGDLGSHQMRGFTQFSKSSTTHRSGGAAPRIVAPRGMDVQMSEVRGQALNLPKVVQFMKNVHLQNSI